MKAPATKNIIARIFVTTAVVEFTIMLVILTLPLDINKYEEAALDAMVLAILCTPLIYILIIKPYIVAHITAMHQVRHMAYHDSLTQLANRRLLTEYLEKLIAKLTRDKSYGAVLFIDLDGFKKINDINGHDAGDATLIEVAKRLNAISRLEDIVSRVGGDEFVIVLSDIGYTEKTATNKALMVAERILEEFNKPLRFKNSSVNIEASIGLRLLPPENIDIDSALTDADRAMYSAKHSPKEHISIYH